MNLKWIGRCSKKIFLGVSEREILFTDRDETLKITVIRMGNEETINIQGDVEVDYAVKILFLFLRLDNLFDGFFIKPEKIIIDGKNSPRYLKNWLPFYKSAQVMDCLSYQGSEWSEIFKRWINLDNSLGIIHNMFLYANYSEDLTPDVKCALILQTFEPLADDLIDKEYIKIDAKESQRICKNCGNITKQKTKITLADKLICIMETFGKDIFVKENIAHLAKMAKNTRNKIVHLDRDKKETLSGKQTGCYYFKFNLLYRIIIFRMLGINDESIDKQIRQKSLSWKDEMLAI